ncbi:DUF5793 family protein [Natronomonas salsuginis]|uniref:DUF5793 family protein n=1 Tax=Natronomonas salsuginis TaxID=2217661 RepID=UPI001C9E331A
MVKIHGNPWSVSTKNTEWARNNHQPKQPTLRISFKGHSSECLRFLKETGLAQLWPDPAQVTFRLHSDNEDPKASGILGVSSRSGEYLLECEASARPVFDFVNAAHQYADETGDIVQYCLWIEAEDGLIMDWDAHMLVVFTVDADVLRHRSLLPYGLDTQGEDPL